MPLGGGDKVCWKMDSNGAEVMSILTEEVLSGRADPIPHAGKRQVKVDCGESKGQECGDGASEVQTTKLSKGARRFSTQFKCTVLDPPKQLLKRASLSRVPHDNEQVSSLLFNDGGVFMMILDISRVGQQILNEDTWMNLRRNYGSIRYFSLLTNFCLKVKFLSIICIIADSSMHYYLQDVYARKGVADDKNKDVEETGKERRESLHSEKREKVLELGVKNTLEQSSDGLRIAENNFKDIAAKDNGSPHVEVEFSISRKKSNSNLSTTRDEPVDGKEDISSLKKQSCWRESERKILDDKGDWKTTQNVPGAVETPAWNLEGRDLLCVHQRD